MTTPEIRSADAGAELPISAEDLALLASQIYAALPGEQLAVEPPSAPAAPRGSAQGFRLPGGGSATVPPFSGGGGDQRAADLVPPSGAPDWPGNEQLPSAPAAPRGSAQGVRIPASGTGAPPAAPQDGIAPLTTVPVAAAAANPAPGEAIPSAFNGTEISPEELFAGFLREVRVPTAPNPSRASATRATGTAQPAHIDDPAAGALWPQHRPAVQPPDPREPSLSDSPVGFYGYRPLTPTVAPPLQPDYSIFDVASIRRDFPVLNETVRGWPLVWFDNAATTQKPRAVIERLNRFYERENSNIHRAAHELAARATDAYEEARSEVARFLGASRSEEVIFVRGTTEAINLVAQSWGRRNLGAGDEILISALEHHANVVPWQIIAQQTGAVLKVAPVDNDGNFLLRDYTDLLSSRTKIVSVTQVANATGTVVPVAEVVQAAHRVGARVLIDGAQSVPHIPVDLRSLGADFFVFSGHKVYGPTGIGAVVIAERVWDETPAWQGGGNMIADVTHERSIYQGPPNKYEAGTGNIADAVGLGAALRYVTDIGVERIAAYEEFLVDYALPRLAGIDGVRLIGNPSHRASVLSFLLAGHEPAEVGRALNERGIAVRAGHHCAQPTLRRLGVEQTVRASLAFYNTVQEVDHFISVLTDLAQNTRSR